MDLPLGLSTALEAGNCVLFLGAGAGHHLANAQGDHAPDAATLARGLADKYGIEVDGEPDLAAIARIVEIRRGRPELIAYLERQLANLEPDDYLQWLMSLTWKAIFTTNYDGGIERCYELNSEPTQQPVVIATNAETRTWDPNFEVPIFHLHGSLFSASAKEAILITEDDYARFREQRKMLFDHFRLTYATTPILYVGYSNRDINWRMVTSELRAEFTPNQPPPSFRLTPSTPALDREILASQGIHTLDGTLADLESAVVSTLGSIRVEPRQMTTLYSRTPTDLHDLFEATPAAVARLLNSWDYVNQADFGSQPNMEQFLKGDRANWALIGQGLNFQRDLEEPLVESLVDFATDPAPRVHSEIILGPAGYGMTTLLMATAAWYAKSKAGTALYLKPGATVLPADIEFAASNLPTPIVFFIDNAADYVDSIATAVQLLRDTNVPAFLLMGERLNEWRQRRPSIHPREHALDPLSDDEIERLLEALQRSGELGHLADLGRKLQFSAIKVKHQQELLVTMREVTEGKAFDAIIEDEFRGIESDPARNLYALVSAFTRVRALARDGLCAEVLGISLSELYRQMGDSVDGIVFFEEYDLARGLYSARARHHVIAEIVWQRCLDRLQRERLMLRALDALNLTFGVDAKAFEAFTRDDEAVDSLQTLEAKTRFFEGATRKDPLNPYVRQHYARMLRRADMYELALTQINEALNLRPNKRILLHTRGVILRDIAIQADVDEVGRRRLAQSEESFNAALNRGSRDGYTYQSLAELYLDWAKKPSTGTAESIDYVTKAEDTVRKGLQLVRDREGLYIVSSKIEQFLGDTPGRVDALRKALAEAPQSAVSSYLLGSVLRRQGDYGEATTILYDALTIHPGDPRLSLAYALTLYAAGKPYSEPIAALNLAANAGQRDPNFVSAFGGLLALNGDLSEAREVWKAAAQKNFTIQERNRVGFEPNRDGPSWLKGRVVKLGPGYAFVMTTGLPDFFCPGSRYSGVQLRESKLVSFRPGFSARGPVVVGLREA